jgi:hypothetical protein
MRRVIKEAAVAAVAGLLLTAAVEAAEPNCLPWASAAPVIKKNSLLPGNVIYQMVQSRTGGRSVMRAFAIRAASFSISSSCWAPKAMSPTSPLTL